MNFRVAIENDYEGRSIAWVLDYPGCYAYGANADQALSAVPDAIFEYADWAANRGWTEPWSEIGKLELILEDSFSVYSINDAFEIVPGGEERYEVNAWFQDDWKPLNTAEIERGLEILTWSREDLLGSIAGLSPEQLQVKRVGERWSIEGVLRHVAGAEWWYLNRLGLAFPKEELPKETNARLDKVRQHLVACFPALAGSRQVVGVDGEFWSPRKLLRRAVWHERDHTNHIHKLNLW